MKVTQIISDSFTVEDIRRHRDEFAARHTDANGNIDWKGATAETEKGAAIVRAELERIRAKAQSLSAVDTWQMRVTMHTQEVAVNKQECELIAK